jgi:choline kinase
MKYILLAAGVGSRLLPLTTDCPKCLFSIKKNYSIIERTVDLINNYDKEAEIYITVGFKSELIMNKIKNVKYIHNPFYSITNSIASLWFAKDLLNTDICIINGDVVMSKDLICDIVTKPFDESFVLIDSSIKTDGDYNVQILKDNVLIMSKNLKEYYGEYVGVTKLNKNDTELLKQEIETMINKGNYSDWYENALVQLIFNHKIELKYKDINNYEWAEIDDVDDLVKARRICENEEWLL